LSVQVQLLYLTFSYGCDILITLVVYSHISEMGLRISNVGFLGYGFPKYALWKDVVGWCRIHYITDPQLIGTYSIETHPCRGVYSQQLLSLTGNRNEALMKLN
jgi:hypothetical protein